MARPSRSRPSSRKNSIVASRSSTTMPRLSIRLSAMCPVSLLDARSAVEHQPADVVSQPLVVKHELADLLWKLLALPLALDSPCTLSLVFRRGGTHGLDRVGGGTELVRGDVRDDCGLASRVRGMPWCAAQVSRGGLGLSGRLARLHHLHLTTHPSASSLDRHTRSSIVGLSRLEQAEDVLRARCRPESEEVVMRLGEGTTATRRHEAGVSDLREDHRRQSYHLHPLTQSGRVETPKSDRSSGARPGGRPPAVGLRHERRCAVQQEPVRCIMPPHWLHAGPRSRPRRAAGTTGGVSVSAAVAGWAAPPLAATAEAAGSVPAPSPLDAVSAGAAGVAAADGPAVSEPIDIAASSAALRARTSGVRMPSSSCMSASRKREASQRMM